MAALSLDTHGPCRGVRTPAHGTWMTSINSSSITLPKCARSRANINGFPSGGMPVGSTVGATAYSSLSWTVIPRQAKGFALKHEELLPMLRYEVMICSWAKSVEGGLTQ